MEITTSERKIRRAQRARRTRARISGKGLPRLSVFRSGRHMYAQIIDDGKHQTLVSAHDIVKGGKRKKKTAMERAIEVGNVVAEKAKEKKITRVVFDRGGFRYHGRVKALADAARKAGLIF